MDGCAAHCARRPGRVGFHKKNCYLASQFKRIAARRGAEKRALVAVAHSILIIVYKMLKTAKQYWDIGADYLEQIHKDQLQRYLVRRLERLGLHVTVHAAV